MDQPQQRAFDAKAESKRLLRTGRAATLATLGPEGEPFASLVTVATMPEGTPILLLSQLSAHTRHLQRDGRCSILLVQGGKGDPLAHPRLTLTGLATQVSEEGKPAARRRFLHRNPKSELYADFPDFSFWTVRIAEAHINGGFARAASMPGADLMTDVSGAEALLAGEDGAIEHMNADHREAIALYATRLLHLADGEWRLSGLDPEGMDLVCGDRTGRLVFAEPLREMRDLRGLLVTLAAEARSKPL